LREEADVAIGVDLGNGALGVVLLKFQLRSRDEKRAKAVRASATDPPSAACRPSQRVHPHCRRHGSGSEDDAVSVSIALAALRGSEQNRVIQGEPLEALEIVGENPKLSVWRQRQDHVELGRVVVIVIVALGITVASGPSGGDEHRPVLVDGEPPGLCDVHDDGTALAIGFNAHHAAGFLLGDEQVSGDIERKADRTLETARDDCAGMIGRNARHRAGLAVGDEDAAVRVDGNASRIRNPSAKISNGASAVIGRSSAAPLDTTRLERIVARTSHRPGLIASQRLHSRSRRAACTAHCEGGPSLRGSEGALMS